MMIELEPSFQNRTGRQNDESTREHETALGRLSFITETSYTWSRLTTTSTTMLKLWQLILDTWNSKSDLT